MEKKVFEYNIGEKSYKQSQLVIGQTEQLLNILKTINFPSNLDVMSLVTSLGDKLVPAIAICLREDGIALKDKDVDKVANDIRFEMGHDQVLDIVENFFQCNPLSSLFKRVGEVVENIGNKLTMEKKTGSKESVSGLVVETSQEGMKSSGDTP